MGPIKAAVCRAAECLAAARADDSAAAEVPAAAVLADRADPAAAGLTPIMCPTRLLLRCKSEVNQ